MSLLLSSQINVQKIPRLQGFITKSWLVLPIILMNNYFEQDITLNPIIHLIMYIYVIPSPVQVTKN